MIDPWSLRPEACETPTAAEIADRLSACRTYHLLSAVIGNPGTGKSAAALRYVEMHRGGGEVVYCKMRRTANVLQSALITISEAFYASSPARNEAAHYVHESIGLNLAERGRELLIIDEAQYMCDDALGCCRDWYDNCGIGIVWFANYDLSDRWSQRRTVRKHLFDPILGRLTPPLTLDAPKPDDVRAIALHHEITDAAAVAVLVEASTFEGGLHNVERVIRIARGPDGDAELSLERLRQAAMIAGVAR